MVQTRCRELCAVGAVGHIDDLVSVTLQGEQQFSGLCIPYLRRLIASCRCEPRPVAAVGHAPGVTSMPDQGEQRLASSKIPQRWCGPAAATGEDPAFVGTDREIADNIGSGKGQQLPARCDIPNLCRVIVAHSDEMVPVWTEGDLLDIFRVAGKGEQLLTGR